MARITITISDEVIDGEDVVRVQTEGMVSFDGTFAEQTACKALFLLAADGGVPWDEIATEVKPSSDPNENN